MPSRTTLIRTLAAVAAACSVVTLAGCGSGGQSGTGEIVIGAAGPLTGPQAALAAVFDGMRAHFSEINDAGGINGAKIRFEVRDDQFNPALTPAVTRELVEQQNVVMACGTTGSANNAAVKDYLEARKVPTVPTSGSSALLNSVTYQVISDYGPLGGRITAFGHDTLGSSRIGVLYGDDPTGTPVRDGALAQLRRSGIEPVAVEGFDPAATTFTAQVAKLKAAGADFVVTNGAPALLAKLINAAEQIGYQPRWGSTFASANVALTGLVKANLDDRVYFSTPFPLDGGPDAAAFRAAMQKYYPQANIADPLVMEGYVMAVGCGEAVKAAAQGGPVTREKLLSTMANLTIENDYVKDVRWTATDHTGAKSAQVITLRGGAFASVADFAPLAAGGA
ncbi:ABC transporter substrate-binding protein [Pseudonocardia sp. RS010]|uniref:ABC transporter substrate-binding protein n=1 Tax=Pseudonocardia sp. RS010 TaxID=3385979 RepID=UPI0039A2E6E3